MIFGIHIYQAKMYVICKNGCPPCCPFELSPLHELYNGKLVHLIPLIPYEIF